MEKIVAGELAGSGEDDGDGREGRGRWALGFVGAPANPRAHGGAVVSSRREEEDKKKRKNLGIPTRVLGRHTLFI